MGWISIMYVGHFSASWVAWKEGGVLGSWDAIIRSHIRHRWVAMIMRMDGYTLAGGQGVYTIQVLQLSLGVESVICARQSRSC